MEDIPFHDADIGETLEAVGIVAGEDGQCSGHQMAWRHLQRDEDAHDRDPRGGDQEGDHGVPKVEPVAAGRALLQGGEEGGRQEGRRTTDMIFVKTFTRPAF